MMITFLGALTFGLIAFATGYVCCWASNREEILRMRGEAEDSTAEIEMWLSRFYAADRRLARLKDMHSNLMEAIENLEAEEEVA